jgi:hypothetical protein
VLAGGILLVYLDFKERSVSEAARIEVGQARICGGPFEFG